MSTQFNKPNFRPNFNQVGGTWSESQIKIVNDLVQEANALIAMFDQVAMLLGPDISLHNVSDVDDFVIPPSKNEQEMKKYCDKLNQSLHRLQQFENNNGSDKK